MNISAAAAFKEPCGLEGRRGVEGGRGGGREAGKALRRSPSHLWSSDWQTQRALSPPSACLVLLLFFAPISPLLRSPFFQSFHHSPAIAVVPLLCRLTLNLSFISVDRCGRCQFMYPLVSPLRPQHSVFLRSCLLCCTALVRHRDSKEIFCFFVFLCDNSRTAKETRKKPFF